MNKDQDRKLLEAMAKVQRMDANEKMPTSSHAEIIMGRTRINSRYSKRHELITMIDFWLFLPTDEQSRLRSMWCDSKATMTYSIELDIDDIIHQNIAGGIYEWKHVKEMQRTSGLGYAEQFGAHMGAFLTKYHDYHNGIYVSYGCGHEHEVAIDPGCGEFTKEWLLP